MWKGWKGNPEKKGGKEIKVRRIKGMEEMGREMGLWKKSFPLNFTVFSLSYSILVVGI
jgi:hypothetical protein